MLKIAICDDNPDFLSTTKDQLLHWPNKPQSTSISCFSNGDALLCAHAADAFDIILLDVVMPNTNGLTTAREIRLLDPIVKIVFLTSSSEFAVESYAVKASNYLLKPLNPDALFLCLDELLAELNQGKNNILVKTPTAVHRVKLNQIEYIEAQNKHTLFALTGEKMLESTEALNVYEDRLLISDGFFKCHRSYIVNIHRVDSYTQKEIKTQSGRTIPLSRSFQKIFEDTYFTVLFGKVGERK